MSCEAGFPPAPAFAGDVDFVTDLRDFCAPDVSLAFGFAVPDVRARPGGDLIVVVAPREGWDPESRDGAAVSRCRAMGRQSTDGIHLKRVTERTATD